MTKRDYLKPWCLLILVYVFFNFAYTSFFPFEVMYLTHLGYQSSDVAILSMATAIGNFFFQFVVSFLLKKQKHLGDCFLYFVGLSIPLAFLLLFFHQSLLCVILFIFPVTLFDFSCIGQLDGLTVAIRNKYPQIEYSRTRLFGSLTGAFASFLMGHVYASIGIDRMFIVHSGVQLLTFITLLILKGRFANEISVIPLADESQPLSEKLAVLERYLMIILGGTMVFLGWRAIFVYLPIIIEGLGGTSADFGNAMAIINASSIIGMLTYPFFRKKLGLRAVLILGCFAMALRWTLTAIAPTLLIIIIVQALESFGFGFAQPAMIESISHMARENDRSSLITIWTGTMMALGTILANIVVQVVSAKTGLQLSFMAFTVLAIVGMGIVLSGCKE